MLIREIDTLSGMEKTQVFHPWRRYLARMLDIFMYNTLWSAFLAFVLNINIIKISNFGNFLNSFVAIAIMLVLEPLWLHIFSTTPGKAIFGLKIKSSDSRRLTYGEGFERTWGVISAGMGYNIPIYNLVRLWKSYKLCSENETQPWDGLLSYTIQDTKWYRGVLYIGAYVSLLIILFTIMSAQQLPPNRGDLTIAEFAENHNYYAKYYDISFGNKYLNEYGKWTEREFDGTIYIDLGHAKRPEYHFSIENGHITGVTFSIEIKNNEDWIYSYNTQMLTSALAFVGAQKEMSLYSSIPGKIAKQIDNSTFKDFQFHVAGITFTCDVEYTGYVDLQSHILIPEENAAETYFRLTFSMNKGNGSHYSS